MRAILFDIIHALVSKYPRWVVLVSIALAVISGFYGAATMQMITDQDRLLSEKLDYHHRYMEFIRTFGDLEFLYVIIEGPTQKEMIEYADTLAGRLRQSDHIQDVIYAFDTEWAADYALYFDETSLEDLQRMQRELESNREEIQDLFSTRSMDEILMRINDALDTNGEKTAPPEAFEDKTSADLQFVIDALKGESHQRFEEFLEIEKKLESIKKDGKKYNWSNRGGFLLMLIMPAKDYSTLSVISEPLKRIRSDIWLTQQDFPNIKAGLTGRPALQADEMTTTNRDSMNASIIALICVATLFILFFREAIRPLLGILTLLCAMGWTYGFIALTLGHLNLLSMVFALILIGLGIDFGIHFLHRYQEELDRESDPSLAVAGALRHAGSGILTGSVTSSVAFLLAMSTNFLGLAELGYVAGIGIIFCLAAMLITLPAFLITYDRHFRIKDRPPSLMHLVGLRHVSRYPILLVIVLFAVTIALLPRIRDIRFNDNLLEMQAEGLESVEYEHKLLEDSEYSTWYCAFVKPDIQGVRETVKRLKEEPSVAKVESLADVLPYISPEKSAVLQSLHATLSAIVHEGTAAYTPNPFIHQSLVRRVDLLEGKVEQLKQWMTMRASLIEKSSKIRKEGVTKSTASPGLSKLDLSSLNPDQLAALQNNPELAAQLQSQMENGHLPERMNIFGDTLEREGISLSEGMQLPEGMDVSGLMNGEDIPDFRPEQIEQIEQQISKLKELTALLSGSQEVVATRLQNANRELLERPRKALHTLARLASVGEPTPDILPIMFKRLFVGQDGSLLIMAYPKDNIWETAPMREFVSVMRAIDPNVTGTPIQVYESSMLMRKSFIFIAACSLLTVSVLVFLDFLKFHSFFYVIFPLSLGVLWLLEIMGTFDIHLNLANFFAIPILIGIGVDNAVHFYHRYLENYNVEQSMYTTGTTLTLTTLTTITGFGSLIFASHKGLASLGILMAIGSATCWFSCVVFLPALIKLTCRHHKARLEYRR